MPDISAHVRAFHEAMGVPVLERPTVPADERVRPEHMEILKRKLAGKLEPRLVIPELGSCLVWLGRIDHAGYGKFNLHRQVYKVGHIGAHRAAWAIHAGAWPGEMCVCHRCDNPPCCNPEHLFLGTRADNNLDKTRKGRNACNRGESNGRALLTREVIADAKSRIDAGSTLVDAARALNIDSRTLWHALKGDRWEWSDVRLPKKTNRRIGADVVSAARVNGGWMTTRAIAEAIGADIFDSYAAAKTQFKAGRLERRPSRVAGARRHEHEWRFVGGAHP